MSDTEILDALQALINEHFDEDGLAFDMPIGRMRLTIHRPSRYDAHTGIIRVGRFDLRETLSSAIEPHKLRLVTRILKQP